MIIEHLIINIHSILNKIVFKNIMQSKARHLCSFSFAPIVVLANWKR